jgi:hypothetical protein
MAEVGEEWVFACRESSIKNEMFDNYKKVNKKLVFFLFGLLVFIGIVFFFGLGYFNSTIFLHVEDNPQSSNVSIESGSNSSDLLLQNTLRNKDTNSIIGAPTALLPGCSLSLIFAPSYKVVTPGGELLYDVTLRNRGEEACKNVSISLYYSSLEEYTDATRSPTASNYYWSIGDLVSRGEYKTEVWTKVSLDGNQIENEGCATANNGSDVCVSNAIFVKDGPMNLRDQTSFQVGEYLPGKTGKEFGTWIWDSPIQMAPGYANLMLSEAKRNGFNVVYVTIDDYIKIAEMEKGAEQTEKKDVYFKALAEFISIARQNNIAVDVEGGWRDWGVPDNRMNGFILIDFVKEYNTKYSELKIRGLQYDVESYLLPNYESNKAQVLIEYVEFIDESVDRIKDTQVLFSIVIPHFYDSKQAWTPQINYNGKTAHTYTHLLDILEKKPNSQVIIMAYRNSFEGANGTKEISDVEMNEAKQSTKSTKIIIAQETGNVLPEYVTFHGLSKSSLLDSLKMVEDIYGPNKNFGGVAVHYIDTFLKLE